MVVQSQFISQFGFPQDGAEKYPSATIESLLQETVSGEWGADCSDDSGTKVIRTTNFTNEGVLDLTDVVVRTIDAKKVEKKQLKKGDIILEKSGGTKDNPVGRLVYFEEEGVFLANNFTQVLRPAEVINSRYLFAALYYLYQTHKPLIKRLGNQTNGIQNLKVPQYLQLQVSVPDRTAQNDFERICRQADKSKFDGLKSQFIEMFGNPMVDEQKYPLKRLGDCCVINPKRSKVTISDSDPVSFVPMPSVSEEGYLQDVSDSEYDSVKKGFTYFENGDVLFAKITPCMENGKGAIAHDLTNGIGMGSTEFHVLRPIDGKSNSYWLFTLTKLPEFREKAAHNMSGTGGQQRVRADFLENFMIGLPPIELQNDLESICRQADKSKYLS